MRSSQKIITFARSLQGQDVLSILVVLTLLCLTFAFWRRIPDAPLISVVYILLLAPIVPLTLTRNRYQTGLVRVARTFYPAIVMLGVFMFLDHIIPYVNPRSFDYVPASVDRFIFGGDAAAILQPISPWWWVDYLQICYLLYFYYPFILVGILYVTDRFSEVERLATIIFLSQTSSFYFYILFPTVGPQRYQGIEGLKPLSGTIYSWGVVWLQLCEATIHNCFPSAHISMTSIVLIGAFVWHRKIFWILLVPCVSLMLATVWLRYHYFADVIAGFANTWASWYLGMRLVDYLERRRKDERVSLRETARIE
ncbi:MAG: phosphatase PAP2 family protein [Planctomycetes bacterium]|nr:phosphatase PAP2 family protein [Planctomycetota bacterium]